MWEEHRPSHCRNNGAYSPRANRLNAPPNHKGISVANMDKGGASGGFELLYGGWEGVVAMEGY